jgi:hypothetical protein
MMSNTTLFVRIGQKNGPTQFMRCGTMFGRAWKCLADVDAATRQRLEVEQMLEVTTEQPEDYNADEVAAELTVQATEAQALADDAKAKADAVAELKAQAEKDAQAAAQAREQAQAQLQDAQAAAQAATQARSEAEALKAKAQEDAQAAASARTEAEQLQQQAAADVDAANKAAGAAANGKKDR